MRIGCPKEIKAQEGRVGLTPAGVDALVRAGHKVYMEKDAGISAGFTDAEYAAVGAEILFSAEEVFAVADMIIKVKEPEECEWELLREGQILYTYLHLAPNRPLTEFLLKRKVKAVAYETITDKEGNLPCLRPMSQIAGRLSIQEGAKYLERPFGGRGVLLGGDREEAFAEVEVELKSGSRDGAIAYAQALALMHRLEKERGSKFRRALELVSATAVVDKMEKGLDSDVGEGGDLLSTGEKQLISFARAVLADPRILILDEATASVDTLTEAKIQAALEGVTAGRTCLMIAHRLSTVRNADMILVVKNGRIVEQGTHTELLKLQGYYYELYTRQYEDEATAKILA